MDTLTTILVEKIEELQAKLEELEAENLSCEELRMLMLADADWLYDNKITAIKTVRYATKIGLKESKDFVEDMIDEMS